MRYVGINCVLAHVLPSWHPDFLTYALPPPPAKAGSKRSLLSFYTDTYCVCRGWAPFPKGHHTHSSSSLQEQNADLAGSASLQPQAEGTKLDTQLELGNDHPQVGVLSGAGKDSGGRLLAESTRVPEIRASIQPAYPDN